MARVFQWLGDGESEYVDLLFPNNGYKWDYEEGCTEDTTRSEAYTMNKEVIATKRAISCGYTNIYDCDSSVLFSVLKLNSDKVTPRVYGHLKFPDPMTGKDIVKYMYTGNPSAEMMFYDDSSEEYVWKFDIKFIEV